MLTPSQCSRNQLHKPADRTPASTAAYCGNSSARLKLCAKRLLPALLLVHVRAELNWQRMLGTPDLRDAHQAACGQVLEGVKPVSTDDGTARH